MKIRWHGHATFRITTDTGTQIVTDPYDPATSGYKPFAEPCDLVVISSATDDFHCNEQLVPGEHVTINALDLANGTGMRRERDVTVRAIRAMEALSHRDFHPDQNGMYIIEADGLRIGHMGDMGNPLSPEQLAFFQNVDVLLALTGGYPTIALPDLKTVIDTCQPKLIIPMHFRTLGYKPRSQHWIQSFLDYFDPAVVDFACASEVTLTSGGLPKHQRVLVLTYG